MSIASEYAKQCSVEPERPEFNTRIEADNEDDEDYSIKYAWVTKDGELKVNMKNWSLPAKQALEFAEWIKATFS